MPGSAAFTLYDTFGFPFELTVEAPIDGSSTEAKITIKTAIKMLAEVKEDGKDIKATVTARIPALAMGT